MNMEGTIWDGEVGTCRREMGKVGQGESERVKILSSRKQRPHIKQ
jgi:hypothetical protein